MKRWVRVGLPALVFSFAITTGSGQGLSGWGIEGRILGGRIVRHTAYFRPEIPAFSGALVVNVVHQTRGRKAWQQRRNYPLVGLGLAYTDYGNDEVLGKCLGVFPNIEFALVTGKRFQWRFQVGMGLGLVDRYYRRTPDWDTLNNAIGTRFNNFSILNSDLHFHVNNRWSGMLGIFFTHVSNAGFRLPNLGLNMTGIELGVRYFPVSSDPPKIRRILTQPDDPLLLHLRFALAFNEYGPANGPLYPNYIGSIYLSKRYRGMNKLTAGVDYSFHTGIFSFLQNNEISVGHEKTDSYRVGAFAGHEFLFGSIGFTLQLGYYLKQSALTPLPYYEKIGGSLYLLQQGNGPFKNVSLSLLLKAHGFEAEYLEMGFDVGMGR